MADFPDREEDADENYGQIYSVDCDDSTTKAKKITSGAQEFGDVFWSYGSQRLVSIDNENMLAIASDADTDKLLLIDLKHGSSKVVIEEEGVFRDLSFDNSAYVYAVFSAKTESWKLLKIGIQTLTVETLLENDSPIQKSDVSSFVHLKYKASDGILLRGNFYPSNVSFSPQKHSSTGPFSLDVSLVDKKSPSLNKDSSLPPLLVMAHGGPTGRANRSFDLQKQFWTSRGFAIFDADYRGSSGYGRRYRDKLLGAWGESDVADIREGIDHLVSKKLVDKNNIFVRGRSSGGYTVFRLLTAYPKLFSAGASYYGIANLVSLAKSTHRFEQFYTDQLIGEDYDHQLSLKTNSRFQRRSPIHEFEKIRSDIILFQGSDDVVVPKSLALEICQKLEITGLQYEYHEYQGEGHGFRRVKNNIDALEREYKFFSQRIK